MAESSQAAVSFHWADYVVFSLAVIGSTTIGLYQGFARRQNTNIDDYLMAGRHMPVLPVSLSLYVSWLSAISFLSDPIEVYYYGAIYWVIGIGYALALPVVAAVFVPRFHSLQFTSIYKYIQERFDRRLRPIVSVTSGISTLIYLSIALYAPSLALSQVTGLDVRYTIFLLGCVSTFYTTLGGMKAVLWADTVQSLVMVVGLLSVLVVGIWKVGGIREVWRIADEGGRINLWNFDPNPLTRSTVWTYLTGGFFRVLNPYMSQMFVQRYSTLHTARQAQTAVYLNTPMFVCMTTLFALTGLVLFATYHDCDPFLAGRITKRDQMVPLLVIETLGDLPGFSGLFLASLCCASLSSTSSGQNSLAATFLSDVAKPIYHRCTGRHIGTKRSVLVAQMTAAILGGVLILMAYLIIEWKSTLFHLTIQITGMIMGPLTGMFVIGMLFSFVDTKSAVGGFCVAFAVTVWLGVGSMLHTARALPTLASTTAGCPVDAVANSNSTDWNSTATTSMTTFDYTTTPVTTTIAPTTSFRVTDLYNISPMLFSVLGTSISVVSGALLGGLSSFIRRRRSLKQSKSNDAATSRDEICMKPMMFNEQPEENYID